jgi:nitric oxide reductase subunit B
MKNVLLSPKTRAIFLFLLVLSFGALLFGGYLIIRDIPPIPSAVKSPQGVVVFSHDDVVNGQNYYFSGGGPHIGAIYSNGVIFASDRYGFTNRSFYYSIPPGAKLTHRRRYATKY